ncbi:MAG: GntR family transcriptional regulator [Clostridia bacterium]|nr:GntR family transcriptional regulator [Clostridia bacterium]
MQFDPMQPIWLQVMTALKADIAAGKRAAGEKLPGGRDLAMEFAINPNTAARVYQELEREGLCETRRGLGTFVTGDTSRIAALRGEMAREAVRRCLKQLECLGVSREEAARILLEEET